jgi:hypothetical protein
VDTATGRREANPLERVYIAASNEGSQREVPAWEQAEANGDVVPVKSGGAKGWTY